MSAWDPLLNWLIDAAHAFPNTRVMLGEVVTRLNRHEFGIIRTNIYTGVLHPQVASTLNVWRLGEGYIETSRTAVVVDATEERHGDGFIKEIHLGHRPSVNPAYKASPLYQVIDCGVAEVRERLAPAESYPYPIFDEFVDAGGTDYCALALPLSDGNRGCVSWVTGRAGGFRDDQLAFLRRLAKVLALVVDVQSGRHTLRTLLNTYLGRDPGELVLSGRIRQGDVERIEAAIWYSDLRGFTERSTRTSPEQLVEVLNRYFAVVGDAIGHQGGEILKFIGDAILAIFPVDEKRDRASACAAALAASGKARAALAELNRQLGDDPLEHGVALHIGEVQYGNIGTEDRLDFTVIGPAVNLASRIEAMCPPLGCDELMSRAFAELVPATTTCAGEFELKGIGRARRLFRRTPRE